MQSAAGSDFDPMMLWSALVRRRWWFFAGFLGCLLAGGVYIALKAPVYEARIKVRIGQVAGDGPFEPVDIVASQIIEQHGARLANGVMRARPYVTRAIGEKGGVPLVELTAEGYGPQEAVRFLESICEEIENRHGAIFQRSVAFLEERLSAADRQRAALHLKYREASAGIARLRDSDPIRAALLAIEAGAIAEVITAIDKDRPEWARELLPPKTESTKRLGEINAPGRASSPKFGLVLSLAIVVGLIVGTTLVLIAEFVSAFRTR